MSFPFPPISITLRSRTVLEEIVEHASICSLPFQHEGGGFLAKLCKSGMLDSSLSA